ncbi:hypothetical protein IT409_00240 [Candidatus Falkowbacteria bacterium]|nr:hypothetical protein [Candidatus Falkowbacteria bacterium]
MQLQLVEYITEQLDLIMTKVNGEDGYTIKDIVMTHISDPDMPQLVADVLDLNGYDEEVKAEVLSIVIDIVESISQE